MVPMARITAARVEQAVQRVVQDAQAVQRAAAVSVLLRAHPRSATQRAADWIEFAAAAGPQAASMQRPPALHSSSGRWVVLVVAVYFGVLLLPTLGALVFEWLY